VHESICIWSTAEGCQGVKETGQCRWYAAQWMVTECIVSMPCVERDSPPLDENLCVEKRFKDFCLEMRGKLIANQCGELFDFMSGMQP